MLELTIERNVLASGEYNCMSVCLAVCSTYTYYTL